jgi:hypothetical protein
MTFEYVAATVTGAGTVAVFAGTLQTASGNWGVSGNGTVAALVSEAGHPGIIRLATNSASGIRIHRGATVGADIIVGQDFLECNWVVRINQTVNLTVNLGLINSPSGSTDFILQQFVPGTSANLTATCGAGGVPSSGTLGVAPGTGWNTYTLRQAVGGTVTFSVNNVVKATINSHVPTTQLLNFYLELYSVGGASVTCDVDLATLESQTLSR